ncbi:MAG: hypothetical protein D6687_07700 [Acidobacteria bacterium]|jgi:hypothetical protein|nr:MAG: hypothetical protein D6687_07700 [Acidobacteriota bacterium]GIU81611.1 MAG: hypothetical protein KatS3mg006_0675 [Pyrinomonadaceae bacterium]
MKRIVLFTCLILLSGCALIETLKDSGSSGSAASLWSDVPKMMGMERSQATLPGPLRLLIYPYMKGMMGEIASSREDTGNWDTLVFSVPKSKPAEALAFYNSQRMSSYGWAPAQGGNYKELGNGNFLCGFIKSDGKKKAGLAIVISPDSQTGGTLLFFLRNEIDTTSSGQQGSSGWSQITRELQNSVKKNP